MAVILQTTFLNAFFNENIWILVKTWLTFVLRDPINNISALARRQAIAWNNNG